MSNDLVKRESNVPATDDGWGNMDRSDFKIPMVKIAQPTSKKGTPGYFVYNNGKEVQVFENCKLIVPSKRRVLFGETYESASRCGSDNFHYPSANIKDPVSDVCGSCPAAQWGDSDEVKLDWHKKLKRKPGTEKQPLCAEVYLLLMGDENNSPFFISFMKTQLKIVSEKLLSRIRQEYPGSRPYEVSFSMGLERTDAYYSVDFDDFKLLDDYSIPEKLYQAYSKTANDIATKEFDAMDAEKGE